MRALTRQRARHSITLREFSLALFSHEPLSARARVLGLRTSAQRRRGGSFTLTYRTNANANIRADLAEFLLFIARGATTIS